MTRSYKKLYSIVLLSFLTMNTMALVINFDTALAENAGKDVGILLQKGVYAGLKGPSLETPAEVRFLKTIGADAVGFSTVQEVVAAVHAEIKVLGLSTITNVHDPDAPVPATVEEIIAMAKKTAPRLEMIIRNVIGNI